MDAGPLHALRNSPSSGNGLYGYAASSTFPTNTFHGENYWVDVLFAASPPPGQPTNVTATAGYASAAVSWTAPATGQVTKYTVTPYVAGVAQTPTVITGDPAPTGTTVTGLTNGTTYAFTVTASNPAGSGPVSAASNPVTPLASTADRQQRRLRERVVAVGRNRHSAAIREHRQAAHRQRLRRARCPVRERAARRQLVEPDGDAAVRHVDPELLVLAGHD